MLSKLDKADADIDKYLKSKEGKDLSEKTQKRVDAMRKSKQSIHEMRKKFEEVNKERRKEALGKSAEELHTEEMLIDRDVTNSMTQVGKSKVYFGGEDYKKAAQMYQMTVVNEAERDEAIKNGVEPSKNAIETEIKELEATRAATKVYIDRKEAEILKKGKLDAKGEKRLGDMRRAYDSLNVRLDRAYEKLDGKIAEEKQSKAEALDNVLAEKQANMKNKTGLEKDYAEIEFKAAKTLVSMSKKKTLTQKDRLEIRRAVSDLVLLNSMRDGTLVTKIKDKTQFRKVSEAMAKSTELNSALSTKNLKPENCTDILADPRVLKNVEKNFAKNIQKMNEKEQIKEKNIQKNNQMKAEEPKRGNAPGLN